MSRFVVAFRTRVFGIPNGEASFSRRGFNSGDPGTRDQLERIGKTFLEGYHVALEEDDFSTLAGRLEMIEAECRGFAYEGAAMAITLLDFLSPWALDRFPHFLHGVGADHIYMLHVGAGWALARLHRSVDRFLAHLDPILGWLAVDGYGFHEGYFYWQQVVNQQKIPKRLKGYARKVFDQGLGRSLWFVEGADISRIVDRIRAFSMERQSDLWSGIGLACTYAGGVEASELERLQASAEGFRIHLAQGAAFAAQARRRAGNPALHTEMACQILCQLSAEKSALITEQALVGLPSIGNEPAYEVWRSRIRTLIAQGQNDFSQPSLLSKTNEEIML
jgi:enediyne biosynthesis protein E3